MSLESLCLQNIAHSILECPPLIQEMVIGSTTEIIKKEMLEQARAEVKDELQQEINRKNIINVAEIFEVLVPEIVDDIIKATMTGRNRTNYLARYWDHDEDIILAVISVAETIANGEMEKMQATMAVRAAYSYYDDSEEDGDY